MAPEAGAREHQAPGLRAGRGLCGAGSGVAGGGPVGEPGRRPGRGAPAGEQDQGVLLREGGSRLHLRGALEAAAFRSSAGGGGTGLGVGSAGVRNESE